jgi:hypothetical protein
MAKPVGLDVARGLPPAPNVNVVPTYVPMGSARRRSARIVPTGHLVVSIPGLATPLELRNMSFGGFAIAAGRPFKTGFTHRFQFANDSGLEVILVAKAVHCYATLIDDRPLFVSGWEFMAGSAEQTELAIGQLLEAAQA